MSRGRSNISVGSSRSISDFSENSVSLDSISESQVAEYLELNEHGDREVIREFEDKERKELNQLILLSAYKIREQDAKKPEALMNSCQKEEQEMRLGIEREEFKEFLELQKDRDVEVLYSKVMKTVMMDSASEQNPLGIRVSSNRNAGRADSPSSSVRAVSQAPTKATSGCRCKCAPCRCCCCSIQ